LQYNHPHALIAKVSYVELDDYHVQVRLYELWKWRNTRTFNLNINFVFLENKSSIQEADERMTKSHPMAQYELASLEVVGIDHFSRSTSFGMGQSYYL